MFRNIFLWKSSISALIKIKLTYSLYSNWRNHSSSICYLKSHDLIDAMTTFEKWVLDASNMISSVCAFVSCPKQGLEMEAVVLHRVGFLAYFCPKQGQDFKPSGAPPYPKMVQVNPPPPLGRWSQIIKAQAAIAQTPSIGCKPTFRDKLVD